MHDSRSAQGRKGAENDDGGTPGGSRTGSRVVFLDIETSPNLSYIWGEYEQNAIEHVQPWYILSFAWAHGEGKVRAKGLNSVPFVTVEPWLVGDDTGLLEALWTVLDEAEVVVAHNGDKFDLRKINARMAMAGFDPPSPYKTVDTLKVARRYFDFGSNRLADLGERLGLGGKAPHDGFETWRGCMFGEDKAWKKMLRYNKQDVELLRKVYYRLRPWMRNHPRVTDHDHSCPTCGSSSVVRRGYRHTKTLTYVQYRCNECGSYSRGRRSVRDGSPMVTF